MTDTLSRLSNENAKGEYYFTDIFELARDAGGTVLAVPTLGGDDVIAPNNRTQLLDANRVAQQRLQHVIVTEGQASIASPANTWIEAGASVGRDTMLLPFTFVGRDARIGRGCTVGPFAHVPAGAVVPDGATVALNAAAMASATGGVA